MSITIGTKFYDEKNGRYIIPDGVGCDPRLWSCIVQEPTEDGDIETVGRQNFMENELNKFKEV